MVGFGAFMVLSLSLPKLFKSRRLLVSFSEFQHGRILLSLIIPDRILWEFGLLPQVTAIEYLSSNLLLPYSGLTFRTLFADLYADFGYAGSLLTGAFS